LNQKATNHISYIEKNHKTSVKNDTSHRTPIYGG